MFRMQLVFLLAIFTSALAWTTYTCRSILTDSDSSLYRNIENLSPISMELPDCFSDFPNVLDEPNSTNEFSEDYWVAFFKYSVACGCNDKRAEEYAWSAWDIFVSAYFDEMMPFKMTRKMEEVILTADELESLPDSSFVWVTTPSRHSKLTNQKVNLRKYPYKDKDGNVIYYRLQNALILLYYDRDIPKDEKVKLYPVLKSISETSGNNPNSRWNPEIKYNGYNFDAVCDDIRTNRILILQLKLQPDEILKMYNMDLPLIDYGKMYQWLERYQMKMVHWFDSQLKTTI